MEEQSTPKEVVAARPLSIERFEEEILKIKEIDEAIYIWIMTHGKEYWANAYYTARDRKYEIHEEMAHVVDLDARTCACRVWRNNGVQAYRSTYATEFRPVPNSMPLTGAFNRTIYPPNYQVIPRKVKGEAQADKRKIHWG
ncbi:hypothetical protein AMTR_s00163p00017620 [Amborella trichopoda]|uniref:Uncharacterized protein n=1 Tax=Amborella trichopoda TaxID=13333 RepID=W1PMV5_AMBTC|nr:hypothetical protein AMTR_s00163p00017620 [Amborella trichopoda]